MCQMSLRFTGVGDEQRGEFAIVSPGTDDGVFVDAPRGFIEEERSLRDVRVGLVKSDVTLALLLGIVEGMGRGERTKANWRLTFSRPNSK